MSDENNTTVSEAASFFNMLTSKLGGRKYIFTIKTKVSKCEESWPDHCQHIFNYMRVIHDLVGRKDKSSLYLYIYEQDRQGVLHIHGVALTFGYSLNMKKVIAYKQAWYQDHFIDIQVMKSKTQNNWIDYIYKDQSSIEQSRYLHVSPTGDWLSDDNWVKSGQQIVIAPYSEFDTLTSPVEHDEQFS